MISQPKPIRVAIIEDHDDFREGLARMLGLTEGFDCVGAYSSLEKALTRIPEPDVILLDIGLPGKSGIEGIPLLREKFPDVQIIMMTVFEDETYIFDAITQGANGYLLKKTHPAKVMTAIEEAAGGGMPMSPIIARKAMELFRRFAPSERLDTTLTPREIEVLRLLVDGLNYAKIAEKLFLSIETVRNHFRHIFEKLHVHSKTEVVSKALKEHLI